MGVGDGQGGLACCNPWCGKESDTTEWLNWTELNGYITLVFVFDSIEKENHNSLILVRLDYSVKISKDWSRQFTCQVITNSAKFEFHFFSRERKVYRYLFDSLLVYIGFIPSALQHTKSLHVTNSLCCAAETNTMFCKTTILQNKVFYVLHKFYSWKSRSILLEFFHT